LPVLPHVQHRGEKRYLEVRIEVEILNELGLHARPAAMFVRCMEAFRSEVFIVKGVERFSCRSILEVLMANLDCGARVVLEATGEDAEQALNTLQELLQELLRQDQRERH
jgi:phosphocarrier protein HPr